MDPIWVRLFGSLKSLLWLITSIVPTHGILFNWNVANKALQNHCKMKGKVLVPHDFHGYVLDWIDGNAVWGELDLFLWQDRFRVSLSLVIPSIVPTNHRMSQIWEMFDSSSKSFCWKTNWVSLSDQQSQHWIEMSLSFGCHQFRSWISKPYSFGNRNKVHFDLHFPEKPKWEHDWEPNGDVPFKSCYLYVHKYIWCICTSIYIYVFLSQTQVVNTSLAKLASFSLYGVSPPGWLYNQHLNVYWNNSEYLASPTYFTSKK